MKLERTEGFEPSTLSSVARCSTPLSYVRVDIGQGSRTRTCDLRIPSPPLYQAELFPDGADARIRTGNRQFRRLLLYPLSYVSQKLSGRPVQGTLSPLSESYQGHSDFIFAQTGFVKRKSGGGWRSRTPTLSRPILVFETSCQPTQRHPPGRFWRRVWGSNPCTRERSHSLAGWHLTAQSPLRRYYLMMTLPVPRLVPAAGVEPANCARFEGADFSVCPRWPIGVPPRNRTENILFLRQAPLPLG